MADETIYIIGQGPSVDNLKHHASKIKDGLIAAVNKPWVYTDIIGNRGFDFVYSCASLWKHYQQLFKYMKDHPSTTVITSHRKMNGTMWRRCETKKQVLFDADRFDGGPEDNEFRPCNSVSALMWCLMLHGFTRFALFGCDGYGQYFNDEGGDDYHLIRDTVFMNEFFWQRVEKLGINPAKINIFNVSPRSMIKCFKTINYTKFFQRKERCGF